MGLFRPAPPDETTRLLSEEEYRLLMGKRHAERRRRTLEHYRREKWRLLDALEKFVNLGDRVEDLRAFRRERPEFCPVVIVRVTAGRAEFVGLRDELHPAALSFRDLLRDVWQGRADGDLGALDTLLGLNREIFETGLEWYAAERARPDKQSFRSYLSESALRAVRDVMEGHQPCRIDYSQMHAMWARLVPRPKSQRSRPLQLPWPEEAKRSEWCFWPAGAFQQAVYLLWLERWRARVCPACSRFFVADKPAQRYCSTRCYGKAKARRSLDWYFKEGAKRRRKRMRDERRRQERKAKARPKKRKRKGGK
jgi:hypothetical protein